MLRYELNRRIQNELHGSRERLRTLSEVPQLLPNREAHWEYNTPYEVVTRRATSAHRSSLSKGVTFLTIIIHEAAPYEKAVTSSVLFCAVCMKRIATPV